MDKSPQASQHKPNKKKQQEVRGKLERYLTRLRKVCGTIGTIEEWTDFTGELNNLLGDYRFEIPQENLVRLKSAVELVDTSKASIDSACQVLEGELENVIQAIPKGGGCSCGLVGGGLLGLAVAGAALLALAFAALTLFNQPTEINLVNQGCEELPVLLGVPPAFQPALNLIGASLPDSIPTNNEALMTVRALPVTFHVDGTSGEAIEVKVLGYQAAYENSENTFDLRINGVSVLDQQVDLSLRDRERHEVVIACR